MKYLALIVLFIGEFVAIYAEMKGARAYSQPGATFARSFIPTLIPLLLSATLLVTAYMLGLRAFGNIWVISAVSLGSILIVEPLFNLLYIGQTPTLGAAIGFALGVIGIIASIVL